jgi:hypothetical protein
MRRSCLHVSSYVLVLSYPKELSGLGLIWSTYWKNTMMSSILWDITPRGRLKVNRRFRWTCRLYFRGRRIGQARNQHGGDVPPKRRLNSHGLHGVISQKIELFITTAARTSNPTVNLAGRICLVSYPSSTIHNSLYMKLKSNFIDFIKNVSSSKHLYTTPYMSLRSIILNTSRCSARFMKCN